MKWMREWMERLIKREKRVEVERDKGERREIDREREIEGKREREK